VCPTSEPLLLLLLPFSGHFLQGGAKNDTELITTTLFYIMSTVFMCPTNRLLLLLPLLPFYGHFLQGDGTETTLKENNLIRTQNVCGVKKE